LDLSKPLFSNCNIINVYFNTDKPFRSTEVRVIFSLTPHFGIATTNDLEVCFMHLFLKCHSFTIILLLKTLQWLLFSKKSKLFSMNMRLVQTCPDTGPPLKSCLHQRYSMSLYQFCLSGTLLHKNI
jgi:hypothetical protein